MLFRVLSTARFLPSSIVIRCSSINKIPIQNQPQIDNEEDDDEADLKKRMSAKDYIFADSKSSRFKEKNKRKHKQWLKELEHRQILPQTPLSPFIEENQPKPNMQEKKSIR